MYVCEALTSLTFFPNRLRLVYLLWRPHLIYSLFYSVVPKIKKLKIRRPLRCLLQRGKVRVSRLLRYLFSWWWPSLRRFKVIIHLIFFLAILTFGIGIHGWPFLWKGSLGQSIEPSRGAIEVKTPTRKHMDRGFDSSSDSPISPRPMSTPPKKGTTIEDEP